MSWLHGCSCCGWTRPATGPTMLAPTCPRCGCVLEAFADGERPLDDEPVVVVRRPGRLARVAPVLITLAPAALAARIGLDHGGALLAVLAAVVTLMLLCGLSYRRP